MKKDIPPLKYREGFFNAKKRLLLKGKSRLDGVEGVVIHQKKKGLHFLLEVLKKLSLLFYPI